MKFILKSLMLTCFVWIVEAGKVITINKDLIKKKRGECVEFRAEHYFPLNASSIFVWKKQHTSTMVASDRITISGDRRKLVVSHLTEADTALYSSEVLTAGGLVVTQYWLVVQGCDVNEKEIDFKGCEVACQVVCLKDWHHFNDKCFRYFSSPKTWLNSYYYCQAAFRGKLATIENEEENR